MAIQNGLDRLGSSNFEQISGRRIAVVCNQASVDNGYRHILDLLEPGHLKGDFVIGAVFGPQHGLFGTTQDNMIEWEGEGAQTVRFPVYSLYGEHREPTSAMLEGINLIVVDLPDIGSRYYTFAWTLALTMKAADRLGIPILVLDRPNPIGSSVEGTVLDPAFASFVGLHPLPLRHGLTLGEIAVYLNQSFYPKAKVDVVKLHDWNRHSYADENGYAWVMPSPNMPTVETAVVYPGGCLIEGTNLSEGRGTTRPFEMIGAPWLNGQRLADSLNASHLEGVVFRPIQFEPTFNKYQGQICNGIFVHVTDRRKFEPVLSYIAIIQESIRQGGLHDSSGIQLDRFRAASPETELPGFAWKQPPYEYEYQKLPIDILFGNAWMRPAIEALNPLEFFREAMREECAKFFSAANTPSFY